MIDSRVVVDISDHPDLKLLQGFTEECEGWFANNSTVTTTRGKILVTVVTPTLFTLQGTLNVAAVHPGPIWCGNLHLSVEGRDITTSTEADFVLHSKDTLSVTFRSEFA